MQYDMEPMAPMSSQQLLNRFGAAKEMLKKMDTSGDSRIPSLRESSAPQAVDEDGEPELPDLMQEMMNRRAASQQDFGSELPPSVSEAFGENAQMPYNARMLMEETVRGEKRQSQPSRADSTQKSPYVDYSLIKDIVEMAVSRALGGQDGQTVKRLRFGDKIQVLDDEGNLYEGELVFKKNIKKK